MYATEYPDIAIERNQKYCVRYAESEKKGRAPLVNGQRQYTGVNNVHPPSPSV